MSKVKVSLRLSAMSIPLKMAKTRFYISSMTNNPNFGTAETGPITPALEEVTAATDALETAHNSAQKGGTDLTAKMHEEETEHDRLVTSLGSYVERVANDSPENAISIVLSSGMDVKNSSSPIGPLPAPENFTAIAGTSRRTIQLDCDKVKGAMAYLWLQTITPADPLSYIPVNGGTGFAHGLSTKAKFMATDLKSGTEYSFMVIAMGTAGESPATAVGPVVAP